MQVISISVQAAIVEEVKQELQKIENIEHFEIAIKQNLLLIVDFESDAEETVFINYASEIDDGEAATGAIAINRNWAIATDDKKATKFLSQESPSLQIVSTPEIIKYWSKKFNNEITMICAGSKILFMAGSKESNLEKTLNELINGESETELYLGTDDDNIELPDIKII